ncbi:hypothetical protein [Mycoplasma procyoni]|uniref:hypothetical protein n=1 Tax=Mycoplasma procyoni TaxID=568784 RepID=UPI00197CA08D|nr:hypothetical protein [Mycoplasma procyoni]MBN3534916.1 hypothetical protein [Mycoplasma procyoni]
MKNLNTELLNYMANKKSKLKKQLLANSIADNIIKWSLIILNLAIIAIAIAVIVIETKRYSDIPVATRKPFLDELGLTIVLASFIVLTFFFNMFLSIYREVMKFKDYKKAMRKISYISYKLKEDELYNVENFDSDFASIEKEFLTKKQISKSKQIKKFLLGGK